MQKLINNGQSEFAYEMLNKFRNDTNLKDFYSMEMGTFFGMRMAYEKAIDEQFNAEVKASTLENKRDKEILVIDLFRTLEASRRKGNL